MNTDPLAEFGAPTQAWFTGAFAAPTAAQVGAWDAIGAGQHALVVAPTGSGKTLAAFLWAIDRLFHEPTPEAQRRCRVLYVSPLKALAADVQRNLRAPLVGIRQAAHRLGVNVPDLEVGMRTGDTPAADRRAFATRPPDILVTTPESLFLILTSKAREGLVGVETVIVDEIHAVAGTKRGAHLALSLERLDEFLVAHGSLPAQRIGLSATVQPVAAVAGFLGGARSPTEGGREVAVVQPPAAKEWAIDVVVPVPDFSDLSTAEIDTSDNADQTTPRTNADSDPVRRASVWPHVEEQIVDLIAAHRSTLVFTNSRRQAERLTTRLNEIWAARHGAPGPDPGAAWSAQMPGQSGSAAALPTDAPVLARAHHGSMSRSERTRTETELKQGTLPAVVATSSLELGIDMGAVDLVIQVGAPTSVASGLQRIGRAGHQVGAVSKGVVFPTHRGDLVQTAVVTQRMRTGEIEAVHVPENPLDVLAQQVIAAVAMDDWLADDLLALVRRAKSFEKLGDATWTAVLDMLAGRYPSEDFAELRARLVWDRTTGLLTARPGAQNLAVTSGGTIPDRGLYGVFLAGGTDQSAEALADPTSSDVGRRQRGGKRVGELDEEMVYESRVGDTFTLGSSTWRIEEITPHQVLVSPAPGLPGRLPFWRGDGIGRPYELGSAVGEFVRELDSDLARDPAAATSALVASGLDQWAADNLVNYLQEQRTATGRVPDDKTIVVERFRDELGDWRVVIHSPFGARVHAPWALVLAGRLRDRLGVDVSAMHADDGIVLRLPDSGIDFAEFDFDEFGGLVGAGTEAAQITGASISADDIVIDPEEVPAAVQAELGSSVLFAARFREAAARALLLPRRRPGQRQPLWQQRHRSAQLLAVAAQFPQFPITLEAARESLQDVFDVEALSQIMRGLDRGEIRLLDVTTPSPSPFAQALLFGYTAQFLYDGDAPLAERRAAALSLDPDLLAELLGSAGAPAIAELLDAEVVARTEAELQFLAPDRQARDAEGLWEVLRRTGPHPLAGLQDRTTPDQREAVASWLETLIANKRAIEVRIAGADQFAVIEDAGRLQDALGVALPVGVPETFTEPVADPLGDLVRRHVRTHAGVGVGEIARRFGLGNAVVNETLDRLTAGGQLAAGAFRPAELGCAGSEWIDPDVLRKLRRRSLAALRADVEPVPPGALGLFLPRWQHVGRSFEGVNGHAATTADPRLRDLDGLLQVIDQLSGAAVPASALETLILPSRIVDYRPELLDELTGSGEVFWAGHGRLPSGKGEDGWISLHLAEGAEFTLPAPQPVDGEFATKLLELLTGSGGFFLPQLAALAGASQAATLEALWELVWAGWVTNDSLAPVRALVGARGGTHRAPKAPARARPMRLGRFSGLDRPTARSGLGELARLPQGAGRWSMLPTREADPTLRAHSLGHLLLARHGVLTRAVAPAEGVGAEYSGIYRVLQGMEDRGSVRRGYFVEHLGGAQFALPLAVDELRAAEQNRAEHVDAQLAAEDQHSPPGTDHGRGAPVVARGQPEPDVLLLAATDPANPYGAALAWPPSEAGHRPGRKAGAIVVLVNGELAFFVERGGRSLLSFTSDGTSDTLPLAARELAAFARHLEARKARKNEGLTIAKLDGIPAAQAVSEKTPVVSALLDAGFALTPRGLRIRPAPPSTADQSAMRVGTGGDPVQRASRAQPKPPRRPRW